MAMAAAAQQQHAMHAMHALHQAHYQQLHQHHAAAAAQMHQAHYAARAYAAQQASGALTPQVAAAIDRLAPLVAKLGAPFLAEQRAHHHGDAAFSFLYEELGAGVSARLRFVERLTACLLYTSPSPRD